MTPNDKVDELQASAIEKADLVVEQLSEDHPGRNESGRSRIRRILRGFKVELARQVGAIRISVICLLVLPLYLTPGCTPDVRPVYNSAPGKQILLRITALEAGGLVAVKNSRQLDRQRIESKFDVSLAKAGASVPAIFAKKWAEERARALAETKAYHDKQAWQIKTNATQARGLKLAQDVAILKTIDLSRIRGEDIAEIIITAARIAAKAAGGIP